jgi:RimJ/RimL family protein N-acetyltransferase
LLRLSYAVSAILPHNTRSRRVAERLGAPVEGHMDVDGRRFYRYVWPLATGDEIRVQPAAARL